MRVARVVQHGDRHTILHRESGGRTVVLSDRSGHVIDHFDERGRLVGTQRLAGDSTHAEVVERLRAGRP